MHISTTARRNMPSVAFLLAGTFLTGSALAEDMPPVPAGFEGQPAIESVIDSYAPVGFTGPDGKPTGIDPDIGAPLGPAMGIDLKVVPDAFENSMLGLASGRVQLVPGASITAKRLETMDFVPYFRDAYQLAVLPDSADIGGEIADLCGVNVGLVTGDITIGVLEGYTASECVPNGKEPIGISTYPDGAAIAIAVRSGRVDAWACALTACSYQNATNPGTWKITGPQFGKTTIGIASAKDSGWAPLIAAGLRKMIEDGSYLKVLEKYEVQGGAVALDEVVVNPTPNH